MQKPEQNEYNPYFQNYLNLVGEGNFFELFTQNTIDCISFFESLPKEKHNYQYAAGKWSVKQVLMHIIDTERVLSYRALVGARGDNTTQLQSYDDDAYANNVDVSNRSLESIIEEFKTIRRATELLYENITEEQSKFKASTQNYPITPRALGFIMIGHCKHHLNVLKERYL
ncbi:MAG: DinB family protein [Bacteroidetes bacterium]|nr:DinB family protein [Bacteroidota bacterium]